MKLQIYRCILLIIGDTHDTLGTFASQSMGLSRCPFDDVCGGNESLYSGRNLWFTKLAERICKFALTSCSFIGLDAFSDLGTVGSWWLCNLTAVMKRIYQILTAEVLYIFLSQCDITVKTSKVPLMYGGILEYHLIQKIISRSLCSIKIP